VIVVLRDRAMGSYSANPGSWRSPLGDKLDLSTVAGKMSALYRFAHHLARQPPTSAHVGGPE